jgi:hypothetical protein
VGDQHIRNTPSLIPYLRTKTRERVRKKEGYVETNSSFIRIFFFKEGRNHRKSVEVNIAAHSPCVDLAAINIVGDVASPPKSEEIVNITSPKVKTPGGAPEQLLVSFWEG